MEPHPSFQQAFTPKVKDQIVEALVHVSEAAVENFAAVPELTTGMTFGVDMYQFANQAFLRAAQDPNADFKADFVRNAFRCRVGEWNFGIYRVGRRSSDNIWECFPNPGNSAGEVGSAYLPGMEPGNRDVRGAIVAYMCDAEEGLGAVYLCIPRTDSDGRITEWAYAEQVWRRDEGPVPGSRMANDSPPPELVDKVTVQRRARGARSAE